MGLPNKPFLINFNAQNYDPTTATFLGEVGQLVDWDATLTNGSAAPVLSEDGKYVTTNGCSATKMFSSTTQNPFNRNSSAKSITIIYKFREPVLSSGSDIFINRVSSAYNYMVRDNTFHTNSSSFLQLTRRLNEADTYYIRIQADGNSEKVNVSTGQRVTASSVSYGFESAGVALFREYANTLGAVWSGDFYYIYISLAALTDEEIEQVIEYNENMGSSFKPSKSSFELDSEGETVSFDLTATDLNWTADIADDWVKLSKTSGYGDDTLSISCGLNTTGALRETTITFTSSEGDSFIISVSQPKFNKLWNKKLFRNNTVVKKIYRSGELIYRRVTVRPTLVLDKDSIKIKGAGGSDTITVQSNTKVTAIPSADWITVTKNGNIFTVSAEAETEKREGTILFKADNDDFITTASVAVIQQNNGYTIDLNNEWIETGATAGYTTYASNSNHNIANGQAKAYIDIDGYTEFKIMVRTQGESNYDYLTVSELDKTPTRGYVTGGTTGNIWTGYGKASATTWYEIKYTNIDGGAHRITLLYSKDDSVNVEPDRGYFYIPEQ